MLFPKTTRRPTPRRRPIAHRNQHDFEQLEPRRVLANFVVTTLVDVVDPGDDVISLREAITSANDNAGSDMIRFDDDLAADGTIALDANLGQLSITDDLTIRGPGSHRLTISGENATRVFHVAPDVEATFERLTIANGLAVDAPGYSGPLFAFGGGIYNEGGSVYLSKVDMIGNQAGGVDENGVPVTPIAAGGAVANEFGGSLSVRHSQFEGNTALGLFSGVGGAITSDRGDASFGTENPAQPTESPSVDLFQTRFVGNTASNLLGPTAEIPLLSGYALGGAVFSLAGSLSISHSVFHGNEAIAGQEFDAGPSIGRGGAVFSMDFSPFGSADSSVTVRNSFFNENAAYGGNSNSGIGGEGSGGAIAGLEGTDIDIQRSRFVGNLAQGGNGPDGGGAGIGGAIALNVFIAAVPDPFPTLSLTNVGLFGNQAMGGAGDVGGNGQGGALAVLAGSQAFLNRTRMLGNHAMGTATDGVGLGGGIYNSTFSSTTLTRSFVVANVAEAAGEGISQGGGIFNDLGDEADETDDGEVLLDRFSKFFTRFNDADEGADLFGI